MVKGFRQIAVLTVISRILGMVRDMAFAYFFGRSDLFDAWTIAFKIPNLSRRIFGEGAATTSFIPVYSRYLEKDPKEANRLANTVLTAVFLILTAVVLLVWAGIWGYMQFGAELEGTRRMLKLTAIMMPYMVMICLAAVMGGILNSHRHFAAPALAPVVLNIFLIGALVISGKMLGWPKEKMVYFTAWAVIAVGIGQLLLVAAPMKRYGVQLRPAWEFRSEGVRSILMLMGPMILGLTATQINTLADDIIAKSLSGSAEKGDSFLLFGQTIRYPVWAGTVSGLFYAQRLYQFPLGVLGVSLATAIYPVLSRTAAREDKTELLETIRRGICGAFFIALPATAGMILIGRPLVAVLFERGAFTAADTKATAWILYGYSLGLCGYFCQQIVTRVYYAIGQSRRPAMTAAAAVGVNVCLNLLLIWPMGAAGLALSTALCSYLQVGILLISLRKQLGGNVFEGWMGTLWKTIVCTILMTLTGLLVLRLMRDWPKGTGYELIRIGAVVGICGGVFLVGSWMSGNEMLTLLSGRKAVLGKKTRDSCGTEE
ncbi:MAG TPA: murein biosynthesis integral membrane protein MurJ [Anaerohalosphaeraceae bacterium]|nr:murein biosynthesis integral membrane protein MurJ [Anaerohalosphaeraceae bacterium]